jgi:hypothetical protein
MVASTDPANNENNVVLNKLVSVTFNMPMKASTITGTTYTLKQGNTAIAGIVSYSGTTAVFTPTVALANTVYTATVSAAVTNLDNTRLPSEYVKFTTGTIVAPTVTSRSIVMRQVLHLIKRLLLTCMVMDPSTINTNFTLKQGTTAITGCNLLRNYCFIQTNKRSRR